MIRIILVAIFLLLYSIISLILYPAVWLIGKFNKKAKDKSSLFIVKNSFKVVRFLSGTKTTVIGYDRIPKDEPVLFVGNHKSYFDIVISYSLMPGLTGFVAKKELKKVPVISCMGAGNKLDPTALKVADIYKTSMCPLAKVMRHELKKRGVRKLKVVYSTEQPKRPVEDMAGSFRTNSLCAAGAEQKCTERRDIPGSVSFVPSVAGLIIAGEVIKDLCR